MPPSPLPHPATHPAPPPPVAPPSPLEARNGEVPREVREILLFLLGKRPSGEEREELCHALKRNDAALQVRFHPLAPEILIVRFDAARVSPQLFLHRLAMSGHQAHLLPE